MCNSRARERGFTMIEMVFGMLMLGVVLLAFMGIFMLFQRSSAQTQQTADAQQNARMAIDYMTEQLRQAGAGTDYVRGQRFIVHAAPYQVAFNADIDAGQTIAGEVPLEAIDIDYSPSTVPANGTTIYQPPRSFDSPAETVVLTLDSNADGVINANDRGDNNEENGHNQNLFMLQRVAYGSNGAGGNAVQTTNLALVRGPSAYPDGVRPQPLFQYYLDDDDDPGTPEVLWGDSGPTDDRLSDAEIAALTPVPDGRLTQIRRVRVTVVSESDQYNKRFEHAGGFLGVTMNSEVYVRNALRTRSVIYGRVFHDANGDGVLDAAENGIPDVSLQLVGFQKLAKSNGSGYFYIPVDAGTYSVRELDPPGYVSTTPNVQSATVGSGQSALLNFGDRTSGPIGFIKGKVFDDADMDGIVGASERGIPDVSISLDSGENVLTDLNGDFSFVMPLGSYDVVEVDPPDYGSTTPNNVVVDLVTSGDTVMVNFGDALTPNNGTIEGYVFEDSDQDGVKGRFESGIPSVTITLNSGDSTITDGSGFYQFSIPPGSYDVVERDPPGYTSSTSNTYAGVVIAPDTVVTLNFGDFLEQQDDFIEIDIGNTARALSIDAVDLQEDTKRDIDLVVGTPFSKGAGNMLVFHNQRLSSKTAISELFTTVPTYFRSTGNNINTLEALDFTGDGAPDVMTGLDFNTGDNIQVWFDGKSGVLGSSPAHTYTTEKLTYVMSSASGDFNEDGVVDVVVGLSTGLGTFTGAFQTFEGDGNGGLERRDYISTGGKLTDFNLGEIWAIAAGDIDGDGDVDIVAGSHTNTYSGVIDVYLNRGNRSGEFIWGARYPMAGAVNAIGLVDMGEDSGRDLDVLVGVSTGANAGALLLFLNNGRGVLGIPEAKVSIETEITYNRPNDAINFGAEVLSLEAAFVNPDIFPDIFVGTRTAQYAGDVHYVASFGLLPTEGLKLNASSIGEGVTMTVADFNLDGGLDVALGTRTSASQGKLMIFFYRK